MGRKELIWIKLFLPVEHCACLLIQPLEAEDILHEGSLRSPAVGNRARIKLPSLWWEALAPCTRPLLLCVVPVCPACGPCGI